MQVFTVSDMTCGGCVSAITKAVQRVAPTAQVAADLATKQVRISGAKSTDNLQAAIADAGFSPERVAA